MPGAEYKPMRIRARREDPERSRSRYEPSCVLAGMPGEPIQTKYGPMTLEQLAEMQPGMARLMVEYAERFWTMYYAAKAGNWALAKYTHSEMMKLGKIVPVVRP